MSGLCIPTDGPHLIRGVICAAVLTALLGMSQTVKGRATRRVTFARISSDRQHIHV